MKPLDRKTLFSKAKRVVIKVGSAVLTGAGEGLDQKRIEQLAGEISAIMDEGREVILVSSGAIAAGLAKLGMKKTKGMPFLSNRPPLQSVSRPHVDVREDLRRPRQEGRPGPAHP